MVNCVAYGCTNRTSLKIPGVTFHSFPKDEIRKQLWVKAVHRRDWTPSRHSKLCSKHFPDSMIDRTSLSCVRLRENACPVVFKAYPSYLQQYYSEPRKAPIEAPIIQCSSVVKNKIFSEGKLNKLILSNENTHTVCDKSNVSLKDSERSASSYSKPGCKQKTPDELIPSNENTHTICDKINVSFEDSEKTASSYSEPSCKQKASDELTPSNENAHTICDKINVSFEDSEKTASSYSKPSCKQKASDELIPSNENAHTICDKINVSEDRERSASSCSKPGCKRKVCELAEIIETKNKKIKVLLQKTKQYKKRITNVNHILNELENNNMIGNDALTILRSFLLLEETYE